MTDLLTAGGFTDEILDPRRTTRSSIDPVRDARDSLVRGDLLLVDVSAYRPDLGETWCAFAYSSPGSASVYPYKIDVPGRGSGQYRASEILAWARPLELHRTLLEIRRETPPALRPKSWYQAGAASL